MAQLGVFLVPPADDRFYQVTTGILGYDVWERRCLTSSLAGHVDPETLKSWLEWAPVFGIHCTITGTALAFDDADIPEIEARLAWIAGRTAPFTLVNGRYDRAFRGAPQALVAAFDSPNGAIQRLHREVVTMVSPLHLRSRYAPLPPRLDERARELLVRTGEPWVLERFTPHWSLMTGLPDAAAWEQSRNLIAQQTGLFADEQTRTLHVADVHLVERIGDGYCTVVGSYPLNG